MIKLALSMPNLYRICIEGNIACGKSSILNYLASKYELDSGKSFDSDENNPLTGSNNIKFGTLKIIDDNNCNVNMIISPEPIQKWINVGGANLLHQMYSDSERWSFAFENYSQITRFEQLKSVYDYHRKLLSKSDPNSCPLSLMHIVERSIFSNRFCFVENFRQSSKLSPVEFSILDEYFRYFITKPESLIQKFVYLRTEPEIVYERVKQRARSEEETIPLNYLTDIHQLHEKLFGDQIDCNSWQLLTDAGWPPSSAKVVVIDAGQPLADVCRQVEKHVLDSVLV